MNVVNFRNAGRWLVLCCLLLLAGSCGKRPSIADMRCEYLVSPISVDTPSPRFTWIYEDADAFEQAGLPAVRGHGARETGRSRCLELRGGCRAAVLLPRCPTAGCSPRGPLTTGGRGMDAGGRRIVSPVAEFETALMETSEWQARWISDAHDKDFVPAPMLRRASTCGPVSSAPGST